MAQSTRSSGTAAQQPYHPAGVENLPIDTFDGGLNLRDSPTEIAPNETPDCMNMTLDERGGAVKRLGLSRLNAVAMAGAASNGYYSPSLKVDIIQIGASLYKTTDWTSFTSFATFSTSDIAAFTDFQKALVVVHPVDGVYSYDGTTWSLRAAGVKGQAIGAWQNKVFVGGDIYGANPSLLTCSATGDLTGWTVGTAGCATNQLREKDDTPITAIGVGQGQDISGRPGLIVCKDESSYRVNDSATLAYSTIDGSAGACGPRAIVTRGGVTAIFSKRGIYITDAAGTTKLTEVSQKIVPLFDSTVINFSKLSGVVAGVYRDRMLFSFPWGSGAARNTRTLEFHPQAGWFVPHDFGAAGFVQHNLNAQKLYTLSPTAAYGYETFKGGSDDGAAISARYRTYEMRPSGYETMFQRLRVWGRGAFQLYTLLDMSEGQGELNNVMLSGGGFQWDNPAYKWNDPAMVWGPTQYEDTQDFWDLGCGKSVSFMLRHTGTDSYNGPPLMEDGVAPEVGAFACYSMLLDHIPLGGS